MPRRGYKVCECGLPVGVRTKKCPDCEHVFQAKVAKAPVKEPYTEPVDVTAPTPPVFKKKSKVGAAPPPPSLKKATLLKVQLNSPQGAHKFIHDLKACLKSAKRLGGAYSAFVTTRDGGKLEIEIWIQ